MRRRVGRGAARALAVALALGAGLTLAAHAAHAWTLSRVRPDGPNLRWAPGAWPVPYEQHGVASEDVTDGSDLLAVRAGFQAWESVCCSFARFDYRGTTSSRDARTLDGVNRVAWLESGWPAELGADTLAVTGTFFDPNTGEIREADLLFNGQDHQWSVTGAAGRADVQSVAAHEAGHFIGLGHSLSSAATMFPTTGYGETRQRSLDRDDIEAACFVYPEPSPAAGCTGGPGPGCRSDDQCPPGQICEGGGCRLPTGAGTLCSPCASGAGCASGVCLTGASGESFCSQACGATAACPGGFSCVSAAGGRYCVPSGGTCGAHDGPLGSSCATGADCTSGLCIAGAGLEPGGACTQPCDDAHTCPGGFACVVTGAGESVCVAGRGDVPTGGACDFSGDCVGGLCFDDGAGGGVCSQPCDPAARDCGAGFACVRLVSGGGACFAGGPGAYGAACTRDDECADLMCLDDGRPDGQFCSHECLADADCGEGNLCFDVDGVGLCVRGPGAGGGRLGDPCANVNDCTPPAFCLGGLPSGDVCATPCDLDADACASGYFCAELTGGGGACVPAGPKALGDACASNLECRSGSCVVAGGRAQCSQRCALGPACTCPAGWGCADFGANTGGRCVKIGLGASGFGVACSANDACRDGLCLRSDARCSRACDPAAVPEACPRPYRCVVPTDVGPYCGGVCSACFDADGDGASVGCAGATVVDCDDNNAAVRPGRTERCNGVDDDCDGATDEGFAGLGAACDSDDADRCAGGAVACRADGSGVECAGDVARVEACDGADDDCDGATDEGFDVGAACLAEGALGACRAGVVACAPDGTARCAAGAAAAEERCGAAGGRGDGVDDDCDGETDEGCARDGGPDGGGDGGRGDGGSGDGGEDGGTARDGGAGDGGGRDAGPDGGRDAGPDGGRDAGRADAGPDAGPGGDAGRGRDDAGTGAPDGARADGGGAPATPMGAETITGCACRVGGPAGSAAGGASGLAEGAVWALAAVGLRWRRRRAPRVSTPR